MSSGTSLRSAGKRAAPRVRARDLIGPVLGLSSDGQPGEKRLNRGQIVSIEHLYNSHPAIQAARSILAGQLLSGGMALRRDGKIVDLKPAFKNHLEETWIPFARSVMDSFLKYGYVVVVYEPDDESLSQQSLKRRTGGDGSARTVLPATEANLVPMVPTIDTYDCAFVQTGRAGYKRRYLVYSTAPNNATRIDEEARVVVRQQPDVDGNVNSPMATIFDLGSFASSLTELALTAEVTNARPRVWTQMQKEGTKGGLDPQALFFDSESRGVASSAESSDNQQQANYLALQAQLMKAINVAQTHTGMRKSEHDMGSFSGGSGSKPTTLVPPEVPPSLMCIPKGQEVAPTAGQMPQARGDLEALQRLVIEQMGAAFGVPSDLLFQGKFASKSTAQLSLLNTTVSQLAKDVNQVLTMSYRDLYGEEDDVEEPATLQLLTSPLAATEEVVNLYAAGLAPLDVAMPAVLHAIGASRDQIDEAVAKATKDAEKKCLCEEEDRQYQLEDQKLGLEERKAGMSAAPAKEKAEADQAKANVAQTEAATKKTLEEAKVAGKPPPKPAASSSK